MLPTFNQPQSEPRERGGDIIYRTLRHLIISGTMPPWTRLVEEDLAREFSTSRSPVREALRRLEHDGLVRVIRRGHLVSVDITADEREDLHLIRIEIDRLAAKLGCARAGEADWQQARDAVERMAEVVAADGVSSSNFAVAHLEVHAAIHSVCFSGPIAVKFAQDILSYTTYADNAHPEIAPQSPVDQHLNLIAELASGDVDRAVRAVDVHARLGYAQED